MLPVVLEFLEPGIVIKGGGGFGAGHKPGEEKGAEARTTVSDESERTVQDFSRLSGNQGAKEFKILVHDGVLGVMPEKLFMAGL